MKKDNANKRTKDRPRTVGNTGELQREINKFSKEAIKRAGVMSAEYVRVKENRGCSVCRKMIPKGELAITHSAQLKDGDNRKIRLWTCCKCRRGLMQKLEREEDELDNERGFSRRDQVISCDQFEDYVDYDDGKSSNGN